MRTTALSPAARFDRLVRPAEFGTVAALTLSGPGREEAVVLVRLLLILSLATLPFAPLPAQHFARRGDACKCEPSSKTRKPRFWLPMAGGFGFLPVVASSDSQPPVLAMPSLVDIRSNVPMTALEGERALAIGAVAPDTATTLPTLMLAAGCFVLVGTFLILPRRRRRQLFAWRSRPRPLERGHGGWRIRSAHRRRVGAAFAGAGGLLLLLGSREYIEGAQAQRRARAEWMSGGITARVAHSPEQGDAARPPRVGTAETGRVAASVTGATSALPLPELAVSGRHIMRGSPVARLTIQSIDLDEVVLEGVGPVELNGGPGHFPGSVLPGGAGNSILSAHRDRHFRRVGEVTVGSHIRTETREGIVEWTVTERRIVSKDTPSLFDESDATLTLTTCWPLRYFGPAPDRLLIIAKRAR